MMHEDRHVAGLDPDSAGRRIGELYERLAESLPADVWGEVAELTQLLTLVHGAALGRMIERAATLPDGDGIVAALTSDPLVASLLVVHDISIDRRPPDGSTSGAQSVHLSPRRSGSR